MRCQQIRSLRASADDPATRTLITDHIATCAACADELGALPLALMQPASVKPPPALAAKIMAALPPTPAIAAAQEQRASRRRRWVAAGWAVVLLGLLIIGTVGLLVDSSYPAALLGGVQSAVGRVALALTLAGKPMFAVLLNISVPLVLTTLIVGGAAVWAWRQLAQPLQPLVAIDGQEGQ